MDTAADLFKALVASGHSPDDAQAQILAVLDGVESRAEARRIARRAQSTSPDESGPPKASAVNLSDTELAIRAMVRAGSTREHAQRVLAAFPTVTGSMQAAIEAERERAQVAADEAAAEAWRNSPDGIRAEGEAALAAQAAKRREAQLARAVIEKRSHEAGIEFDASVLSDDEAIEQIGLAEPKRDPQAQRVADADARYAADPLGAFKEHTLADLRSRWSSLSVHQQQAELQGLGDMGIDASSVAAEMQGAAGDPQ